MTGGAGPDTFVFKLGLGKDVITDFEATTSTHDVLEFEHHVFANLQAVLAAAHQVGATS